MTMKQIDLSGKVVTVSDDQEKAEVGLLKSALQKCIRRGQTEKAMYFAIELAKKGGWYMAWRRLRVIAVEDVGQSDVISAVEALYRQFLEWKGKDGDGTGWDCLRCVACAAKILADAPKDRRADEMLELLEAFEKCPDDVELQQWHDELSQVPDDAYDMHTLQGKKMGRGLLHWYTASSYTDKKSMAYNTWRHRFESVMTRLVKEKRLK